MKIYTKRGDEGQTDLFGGARVKKNHIQVKVYGEIDSANSFIGSAHAEAKDSDRLKNDLEKVMKLLFSIGSEVATANKDSSQKILERALKNRLESEHVKWLEDEIDFFDSKMPQLKSFILPSGSLLSAKLHLARTQVRKAEIALLDLEDIKEVRREIHIFFNRLSDFLFVAARFANFAQGEPDLEWNGSIDL